jgi:hypothetical protein
VVLTLRGKFFFVFFTLRGGSKREISRLCAKTHWRENTETEQKTSLFYDFRYVHILSANSCMAVLYMVSPKSMMTKPEVKHEISLITELQFREYEG